MGLIKDIIDFLSVRKKYWLAPLILALILVGALILLAPATTVSPFVYPIF